MTQVGAPMPTLSAVAAVCALGVATRPLALLLAACTLVAALIGHRSWTMEGAVPNDYMEHFFKSGSIADGLLLLYVSGSGTFALNPLGRRPKH